VGTRNPTDWSVNQNERELSSNAQPYLVSYPKEKERKKRQLWLLDPNKITIVTT